MKTVLKFAGEKSRKAVDDFMKSFKESDIDYIIADLQLSSNPLRTKGNLQIKIKKK
jgi:hypothetical protein